MSIDTDAVLADIVRAANPYPGANQEALTPAHLALRDQIMRDQPQPQPVSPRRGSALARQVPDVVRRWSAVVIAAAASRIRPAGLTGRKLSAGGIALVLSGGVVGAAIGFSLGNATPAPVATSDSVQPVYGVNGWVAFIADGEEPPSRGDLYIARDGEEPRVILDADGSFLGCPSFTADGTRLVVGRATGEFASEDDGASLVILDIGAAGTVTGRTEISLDRPGADLNGRPCPIWSADGRWLAFGADAVSHPIRPTAGDVWIVEVESGEVTVLDAAASDLAWSPARNELYLAGETVRVYSPDIGEVTEIADTERMSRVAPDPDGDGFIAARRIGSDSYQLERVDRGGAVRVTVGEPFTVIHGGGLVWSSDGSRIAYMTGCHLHEQGGTCSEPEEVRVLTLDEDDPAGYSDVTVLGPHITGSGNDAIEWLPWEIAWSPDGRQLVYTAWGAPTGPEMRDDLVAWATGILTVPIDGSEPSVLFHVNRLGQVHLYWGAPTVVDQMWGRARE